MSVEHVALRAPAPRATTVPWPLEIVLLLEAILLGGRDYCLCELVGSEFNLGTHRHRIGRYYE